MEAFEKQLTVCCIDNEELEAYGFPISEDRFIHYDIIKENGEFCMSYTENPVEHRDPNKPFVTISFVYKRDGNLILLVEDDKGMRRYNAVPA